MYSEEPQTAIKRIDTLSDKTLLKGITMKNQEQESKVNVLKQKNTLLYATELNQKLIDKENKINENNQEKNQNQNQENEQKGQDIGEKVNQRLKMVSTLTQKANINSKFQGLSKLQTKNLGGQDGDKPTNIMNALFPMRKANNFIKNLQNKIFMNNLNDKQYEIINDLSFSGDSVNVRERRKGLLMKIHDKKEKELSKMSTQKQQLGNLNRLLSQIKKQNEQAQLKKIIFFLKKQFGCLAPLFDVIHPDSNFRVCFDIFCMLLIFFDLIVIPLKLSFEYDSTPALDMINTIIQIAFIMDIILTFNTGYYKKGILTLERKKIVANYIQFWFWINLLSTFPFDLVTEDSEESEVANSSSINFQKSSSLLRIFRFFKFLKVIRLLRVVKLKTLFEKMEEYLQLSEGINGLLKFLKLSLVILFIAHFCACAWHLIAVYEFGNTPHTWLTFYQLDDDPWQYRYLTSIYWVMTTMITVGYGDITPQSDIEIMFALFTMILASGVFAYTMNSVGQVFEQLEKSQALYKQRIVSINSYMKRKQIRKDLQQRIRKYLEYVWNSNNLFVGEENMLSLLSTSLRHEVVMEINGKIMKSCTIFQKHFSSKILYSITLLLKEKTFLPEEKIIQEGLIDEQSIFFVNQGSVNFEILQSNTIMKIIEKGGYFGEISFFTDRPRTATARSSDFTSVFFITREKFLQSLQQFPQDKEKYHMIKDKIVIYDNYEDLSIVCYSCGQLGHIAGNCPKIHFVIDVPQFINIYLETFSNFRGSYQRKQRKQFNAFGYQGQIKETILKMQRVIYNQISEENAFGANHNLEAIVDDQLIKGFKIILKGYDTKDYGDERSNIVHKLTQFNIRQSATKKQVHNNKRRSTVSAPPPSGKNVLADNESKNQLNTQKNTNFNTQKNTLLFLQSLGSLKKDREKKIQSKIEIAKSQFEHDFDQVKIYNVYFPQNNIIKIIQDINKAAEVQLQLTKEKDKIIDNTQDNPNKTLQKEMSPKRPSRSQKTVFQLLSGVQDQESTSSRQQSPSPQKLIKLQTDFISQKKLNGDDAVAKSPQAENKISSSFKQLLLKNK